MCLAQGPQRSDAGEARTRYPSVSSQALYHWATALPGLKLENGILQEVGSNESDAFACWSTISFPWIPIWLGIQQKSIFFMS